MDHSILSISCERLVSKITVNSHQHQCVDIIAKEHMCFRDSIDSLLSTFGLWEKFLGDDKRYIHMQDVLGIYINRDIFPHEFVHQLVQQHEKWNTAQS